MTNKFFSKELHFLKNDSDDLSISPPDNYFSDFLLTRPVAFKTFEKRLAESDIPGENFLCAAVQVSSESSETILEKAKDAFESAFTSILAHGRGMWESLDDTSFAMAFWDYKDEKNASRLIVSLKEKIHHALKADILMGVSKIPYGSFSREQTFHNALKAADHAAFFGPDTLIHFDAVSLNICGDRFYHLGECDRAIKEYEQGLQIKPKDMNLLNSLGVCHAVMGELEKAKEQFDKAMKINPDEIMIVYNMGLLCQIHEDTDKAIVYLRRAHGISKEVFEVELLLGDLLFKKGKAKQALPHLENAEKINPDSGKVFRLKGEIYLEKNDPEKAVRAFSRALKLAPSDAVSLSGYAKSMALRGKNLQIALSFAQNSVTLAPDNPVFKERLEEIQDIIDQKPDQETSIKTA